MPPTSRQGLTQDQILDAALALSDERGLDALSMRAVAERVGVTPMALYPHIGSKDALLDGLVARMLGEFLPTADPILDAPWPDQLRMIGHSVRAMARLHPAAFTLLFARPAVAADAVRVVDLVYRMLLSAGVPDDQVPRLERLVTTFCLGYALSEINGRFDVGTVDPRGRRKLAAPGSVPAHERLAPILDVPPDWDAEYAADLEDLVELVRRASHQ